MIIVIVAIAIIIEMVALITSTEVSVLMVTTMSTMVITGIVIVAVIVALEVKINVKILIGDDVVHGNSYLRIISFKIKYFYFKSFQFRCHFKHFFAIPAAVSFKCRRLSERYVA